MTTAMQKPCPEEAQALCFAMTGHIEGVARVARLAQNRLTQGGWSGWKITGVDFEPEVDGLDLLRVAIEPIGHFAEPQALTFALDVKGLRPSQRFAALVRAVGIRERIDDDRELVGRFFAMSNRGKSPSDFTEFERAVA